MTAARIPYTRPSVTELEVGYATDAARHGWGEHCYDYLNRFEARFREYLGVKHAIATSSCTGALHMGLAALGVGAGDEVILADSNWIASVAPAVHLGATPVFVDILADSWCLDPAQVEAAITPRTKAIVAVHLYGNLCAMDRLLAIGRAHGIPVVEDAAEALGSIWHAKRAGSLGAFGAFSFHGTKTLTTGEGGMFVTDDDRLHETVLTLSNHGRARGQTRQFWPDMLGFKYKMSNVQAAIGCGQLERIAELESAQARDPAPLPRAARRLQRRRDEPGAARHAERRVDADRRLRAGNRRHARAAPGRVRGAEHRCARLLPSAVEPADVRGLQGRRARGRHPDPGDQPAELPRHDRRRAAESRRAAAGVARCLMKLK